MICVKVYTYHWRYAAMPSQKPLIALRLEQPLYDRVVAVAMSQGRTPTNFIAQHLRTSLGMAPSAPGRQVDITEAIAEAVKRGPVSAIRARRR